jgi:hypothetical protein
VPYQANLPMPYSNPEIHLPAVRRATKTVRAAELAVFNHQLAASVKLAVNRIDSDALSQAAWCCLDEEVRFLNDGLRLVGNSQAGQELLAQKLDVLATSNNARLREFGR